MAAPATAGGASSRLDELRQQSQAKLANFSPREYSLRSWINTARVAFETADRHWKQGRLDQDVRRVEEAFLEYKRAAGIMQIIMKHPDYQHMVSSKTPEYMTFVDLRRLATEAREPNEAVVRWLEQHEPPRSASNSQDTSASAGSSGPGGARGSQNASSRPDPQPSRPGPQKTPSFPTTSLAERMAALRASGLSGAASSSSGRPAGASPPSVPQKNPAAAAATSAAAGPSLPPRGGAASARLPSSSPPRQADPPLASPPSSPRRPPGPTMAGSSRNLRQTAMPDSPSTSPRVQKGDLVADDAIERSGSAPPILPYSRVQEPARVWEDSALQFQADRGAPIEDGEKGVRDRGPAGGVDVAPPRDRISEVDTRANQNFAENFPSLDDFERRIVSPDGAEAPQTRPRSASTSPDFFQLPSVPTSDPSSPSGPKTARRLPPPHPPKPQYLDEQTFRREQQERADAMAKLAAGLSNGAAASPQSPGRGQLPPTLVPGSKSPQPERMPSPHRSSALSPLPTGPQRGLKIPFATEVRPLELWQYIQTAKAEAGEGPRVLLLDVRNRDDYERGRIRGETVCLEPIILRDGIRSAEIEDALSLSPPREAELFNARNRYDVVVIYDRASASPPTGAPTSTSSDAQRVLWNLVNAIYEREFSKHLARQPILLRGGWEAWEKTVGPRGCVGSQVSTAVDPARPPQGEVDRSEAKRANRKATMPPGENGHLTNGYNLSTAPTNRPHSPYQPSPVTASVMSPRLAVPPVAAQRHGTAPEYDPFTPSSSRPAGTSRPVHPQPPLNGYGSGHGYGPSVQPSQQNQTSPYSSDLYSAGTTNMNAYVNGDLARGPSGEYARPAIDYPQLHHRSPPPPVSETTRPPPRKSSYDTPATSTALTRPPPARPAPPRINSSFSSMQPAQYSAAHSRFPTSLLSFDEGVIGISGLKNLGNTCYMNSTIQCLSAAVPFARYFTGGGYRRDINTVNPLGTKGALANAVAELIRMLWAQQYHFLSPVTFREAICRVAPSFRGSEQHDAQEFLGFLLDGLHEDCNYVVHKPPPIEMTPEREHDLETLPPQLMSEREWQIYKMRNDSFIVQCFQGQFRNQMRCLTCNQTSTTYNTFMPLSIPIPGGRGITRVSLTACLETFVRDEILDGDDMWHCSKCKKERKSVKKLSLSKLPPILVIHLKRFSFHGPFSDKLETQVQYPLTGLDLTGFVPPPLFDKRGQPIGGGPPNGYVYDLFGVTNHYGNLSSGHYTAFVRSGRDWFNIGDSKVTPCNPKVVESAKSAYILYYTLRS